MQFAWFATFRNHQTGQPGQANGTTDARNKQQAEAQARAEIKRLPGRKTAIRVDIY